MSNENEPLYVIYAKGQDGHGYKWYNTKELSHGDYPSGWSASLDLVPTPRIFSIEYKWKFRNE